MGAAVVQSGLEGDRLVQLTVHQPFVNIRKRHLQYALAVDSTGERWTGRIVRTGGKQRVALSMVGRWSRLTSLLQLLTVKASSPPACDGGPRLLHYSGVESSHHGPRDARQEHGRSHALRELSETLEVPAVAR